MTSTASTRLGSITPVHEHTGAATVGAAATLSDPQVSASLAGAQRPWPGVSPRAQLPAAVRAHQLPGGQVTLGRQVSSATISSTAPVIMKPRTLLTGESSQHPSPHPRPYDRWRREPRPSSSHVASGTYPAALHDRPDVGTRRSPRRYTARRACGPAVATSVQRRRAALHGEPDLRFGHVRLRLPSTVVAVTGGGQQRHWVAFGGSCS